MTALEYLIDGLEAELELERELGVRVVELDRALLSSPPSSSTPPISPSTRSTRSTRLQSSTPPLPHSPTDPLPHSPTPPPSPSTRSTRPQSPAPQLSFAFLHDGPLSSDGIEMMAKIVTAMHETPDTAPIVFTGERPAAKIYVVLGSKAMKKWYPGMHASPGQWLRGREGEDVLVTYSPEYILRFGAVTPAVKKIKSDMWTSLKGVMQRIGYSK
ncbi:MAG: hypothetical protein J6Q49_06325 [Kiritimatiellae bacterium]|nr:hypothetical protein [Kiritimatiellia bacterium]